MIDEILEVFVITRSLSQADCPYDNAVAESIYCYFKIKFFHQETFHSLCDIDGQIPLDVKKYDKTGTFVSCIWFIFQYNVYILEIGCLV